MRNRITGILPAVVLVAYLVTALLSFEGSVLCFGRDGHVAVEFVDACNGSGFGSQLAGRESDACGPCTDVQFLNNAACTKNALHDMQMFPPISSSPMSPSLPSKDYHSTPSNPPQYSPHKTLAGLHSIVLLI